MVGKKASEKEVLEKTLSPFPRKSYLCSSISIISAFTLPIFLLNYLLSLILLKISHPAAPHASKIIPTYWHVSFISIKILFILPSPFSKRTYSPSPLSTISPRSGKRIPASSISLLPNDNSATHPAIHDVETHIHLYQSYQLS